MNLLTCIRPYGVQVFCDNSDAKIRNACMGDVADNVHKYVHLVGCEYYSEIIFGRTTYTLEVSVDHIAGMQVAEAFCDLR